MELFVKTPLTIVNIMFEIDRVIIIHIMVGTFL